MKRLIKLCKHKEETEEDVYTRWEKDFDLVPNSVHGLFYEYLELGVYTVAKLVQSLSPTLTSGKNAREEGTGVGRGW